MFGRLKVYLIMFAAFAMFAGMAYWYYQDTQKALQTYAENQAKLQISLSTQKQATDSLQNNIKVMTETIRTLNDAFAESRENVKTLERQFNQSKDGSERDFGKLAIEKPAAIERAINKGTGEVFRCIELLSGQPPKTGETDDKEYIDCLNTDISTN